MQVLQVVGQDVEVDLGEVGNPLRLEPLQELAQVGPVSRDGVRRHAGFSLQVLDEVRQVTVGGQGLHRAETRTNRRTLAGRHSRPIDQPTARLEPHPGSAGWELWEKQRERPQGGNMDSRWAAPRRYLGRTLARQTARGQLPRHATTPAIPPATSDAAWAAAEIGRTP